MSGRRAARYGTCALALASLACGGGAPQAPAAGAAATSLVVLTLDTTRADRLEPYGAGDAETPNLARLAAAGAVFERAYAVTPVTLPSHASLFSGLDPTAHGVRNNGVPLPAGGAPLLAERLAGHGLRAAAFVSAAVLDRRFGLDRGFALYDDDLGAGGPRRARLYAERPARATVDAALAWLDELAAGERFFLWVHLFEPHAAWEPPPPFAERFRGRPYDGEIAAMDAEIGRLLAHPRIAGGGVAVMAIGDHGESLGEHGEETHAMLAYDATLRVPWIVRAPGVSPGSRVATPVSQIDLPATALELLGLPAGSAAAGVSLAPALAGGAGPAVDRPLYAESLVAYYTYGWAPLHSLRRGRWKLVRGARAELYDLTADPGELDDLARREPERAARLEDELEALVAAAAPPAAASEDRELAARLRGLGYLGGGGEAVRRRERPDPAALIAVHLAFERAADAFQRRELGRAIPELRAVLARDGENLAALTRLALALSDRQEHEEALALAERAVALAPELADPRIALGLVRARAEALEDALDSFATALALEPSSLEARIEMAQVLFRLDRRAEGERRLREVLAIDEEEPRALIALVEHALLVEGELAAGERRLREVLSREPFQVEGWRALGRLLERDGRSEEAIAVYRQGLGEVPEDGLLHARLGLALARLGRDGEAGESLRRAVERLRPGSPAVHNALAGIHLRRGEWAAAEAEARRALELAPAAAAAWNNLAAALEEQGDPEEALAAYGRALEADPGFWQAELNRALLLAAAGRFEAAAAGLLSVTAAVPGHLGAHFELGRLYLGPLDRPVAGARHLRIAAAGDPTHPRAAEARRLLTQAGLPTTAPQ